LIRRIAESDGVLNPTYPINFIRINSNSDFGR